MLRKVLLSGLFVLTIAPMMQARADMLKFEPDNVNSKITAPLEGRWPFSRTIPRSPARSTS